MSATTLDAAIAEHAPALLERVNHDFEDSIRFLSRVLCQRPDATAAEVQALDASGVEILVRGADGSRRHRLDFAAPVERYEDLTGALFGLILQARETSGEDGLTSAERELEVMAGIRTSITQVRAVADVHPHLRCVTLAGGDLTTFRPLGPDTFVYVLAPPPGRSELTIDASFTWEAFARMPVEEQPVGAYYTVRAWRPELAEVDLLVVLHGDEGSGSAWATRVRPGDPVALWGPRCGFELPADADAAVLIADDTGLPAVARILEALPDHMPAWVLAEVDNPAEQQPLPERPDTTVRWLHRHGAPAGTTTLLADTVRDLPWPAGRPYVWAGAEHRAVADVRALVRGERGVPRERASLSAYWRAQES